MTTSRRIQTLGAAVAGAAILGTGLPAAHAATSHHPPPTTHHPSGWSGIARHPVAIDMGKGWTAHGELDVPRGSRGRLPVVVLLHGSGHNDRDQTMPEGGGSTFVPISQAAAHRGFAVLRFDKRGVTGVGPTLSTDPAQLAPARPYRQILQDAGAVVRYAAASPRIDPSRIFLLGHSEGTQVASNLAAHPAAAGIPTPAGVVEMGVVGVGIKQLLSFQINGARLARLHEESDIDGDGYLTYREAVDGLIGQSSAVADGYRKILLAGTHVNPVTDRDHDGRLAIDTEVGPVVREQSGIGDYPAVPGVDQATRDYLVDIARFPNAAQDLPRFGGPVLLLNGESDIQTPDRAARVADAALTAARNPDHQLRIYPGMAHTMNITPKFTPAFGDPDPQVVRDIVRWLAKHRG